MMAQIDNAENNYEVGDKRLADLEKKVVKVDERVNRRRKEVDRLNRSVRIKQSIRFVEANLILFSCL